MHRTPRLLSLDLPRLQLAGLLCLVAIALAPALTAAPAQAGGQPHRKALPIGSRLYDLGVADIDHDGRLDVFGTCLLYTSPSPRDGLLSRMPSSA